MNKTERDIFLAMIEKCYKKNMATEIENENDFYTISNDKNHIILFNESLEEINFEFDNLGNLIYFG